MPTSAGHLDGLLLAAAFWDAPGMWIAATGAVANMACASIGCLLVLRRLSLMGDAISHAVLPGLAIAFLWTGSYRMGPLFLGAALAGLLAAVLTQTLRQFVRIPGDASMGIVFTSMFAVGVILVRQIGQVQGIHFDVQCVYEGSLEYAPLFRVSVAGWQIPRALAVALIALVVNLAALTLLWKEWKLSSFDPALADTMGFSATGLHLLLMVLVAATTVACFEAVGSILVVAMLIVPASTAHLLTDRLAPMILWALVVAALAAVIGYASAHFLEQAGWSLSVAGLMTVASGGLLGAAVLFSPTHGVVVSLVRHGQMTMRVAREDVLAMLYRAEELDTPQPVDRDHACRAIGGGWLARRAVASLAHGGDVVFAGPDLRLTARGREAARHLVRSHRLWENYLVEQVGLATDHVHEPAHRVEHYIDAQLQKNLEARLEETNRDPHGREIPE